MKKYSLALLYLISFLISRSQANNFRDPAIDVQHYDFRLKLTDADDHIEGDAIIKVKFLKASSTVSLDLVQKNSAGKGMLVSAVSENGKNLNFSQNQNIVQINLGSSVNAGDQKEFEILYSGVPADGMIISKNKFGKRTFFADNWPNRAHNWIPCNDHPSDKASVEFEVTAPSHYQVVGNGILIEETAMDANTKFTHWREDVVLPTKIMAVGVAEFAIHYSGNVGNIPVYSWVFPENKKEGFYDYDQAVDIMPFYISKFGPYPYLKLANVQSKTIFGGMENANTIFYDENTIKGDRKTESLLAHEIAHQWFGNSASETHFSHLWLSEGFATYMTDAYLESHYGTDTLKKELQAQRAQVIAYAQKRFAPVVDTSTSNYMIMLNPNSYEKGGWVLHMLRRKLGDEIFWKGISTYYGKFAGRNASTEDLQKVFESVSGKDLSLYFKQWLYQAGHPQVKISWQYIAASKTVKVTIIQTQKNNFEFPLDLGILAGNSQEIKTIQVNDKNMSIQIPVSSKPDRIVADPSTNLLFEGTVVETP